MPDHPLERRHYDSALAAALGKGAIGGAGWTTGRSPGRSLRPATDRAHLAPVTPPSGSRAFAATAPATCPQCRAAVLDRTARRCACGAALIVTSAFRAPAAPPDAPSPPASGPRVAAAAPVPFHFYAIPIGLAAGEVWGFLGGSATTPGTAGRIGLASLLVIGLLCGSKLAMKVTRILLTVAIVVLGVVFALLLLGHGAIPGAAVVLSAFWLYAAWMLLTNKRLQACYA